MGGHSRSTPPQPQSVALSKLPPRQLERSSAVEAIILALGDAIAAVRCTQRVEVLGVGHKPLHPSTLEWRPPGALGNLSIANSVAK